MKLKGAEIILECLIENNVDTIFGYPGGAVIPLYDALYDYKDRFNHIRTAHEQGAVHAADGYARSTGKIGVCFATSGPGATNTITGIATAYMDSVPLVIITGQVPTPLLGKDSFQEIDITGITLPITKHNYLVKSVDELGDIVREAFIIAKAGRPGPVLIDVPKDILMAEGNFNKTLPPIKKHLKPYEDVSEGVLKEIAKEINLSNRPIIYAGGGVILSQAWDELKALAEKGDIPVVNTLMGLSSFPRDHELSLGLVGMHGFPEANLAVTNSDLIIAIGARFSDRVIGNAESFAPRAKVIHIDIDKTEIGKNKEVSWWVIGDVKNLLKRLINNIDYNSHEEWKKEIKSFQRALRQKEYCPNNILEKINKTFEEDTVVVTDVGQHQMWTAQYWKFKKPRTFISSGGLGTMGYGLGAAIGSQIANPDKRVILITGDGSFRMNCNELATVSRYNIPLTIFIFNNNTLGMVRQWQKMFNNGRYSETDLGEEVDYVKLAEAYNIKGYRINSIEGLNNCLELLRTGKYPAIIECTIEKDDCVLPIVPPGNPIDNFIIE